MPPHFQGIIIQSQPQCHSCSRKRSSLKRSCLCTVAGQLAQPRQASSSFSPSCLLQLQGYFKPQLCAWLCSFFFLPSCFDGLVRQRQKRTPSRHTQGDFTPIFPTFSNPILNLNFYINSDPGSIYLSNIRQNRLELCTNLRFCNQAPIR